MKKLLLSLVIFTTALTVKAQKFPAEVTADTLGKSNTNTIMVGKSTIVRTMIVDNNRTVIITDRFWKGKHKSKDFYVMEKNGSITSTEGMPRKKIGGREYYWDGNAWVYWDGNRLVIGGGVGVQSYPRSSGYYGGRQGSISVDGYGRH